MSMLLRIEYYNYSIFLSVFRLQVYFYCYVQTLYIAIYKRQTIVQCVVLTRFKKVLCNIVQKYTVVLWLFFRNAVIVRYLFAHFFTQVYFTVFAHKIHFVILKHEGGSFS